MAHTGRSRKSERLGWLRKVIKCNHKRPEKMMRRVIPWIPCKGCKSVLNRTVLYPRFQILTCLEPNPKPS